MNGKEKTKPTGYHMKMLCVLCVWSGFSGTSWVVSVARCWAGSITESGLKSLKASLPSIRRLLISWAVEEQSPRQDLTSELVSIDSYAQEHATLLYDCTFNVACNTNVWYPTYEVKSQRETMCFRISVSLSHSYLGCKWLFVLYLWFIIRHP